MKIGSTEEGRGGNEGNLVKTGDNGLWRRLGDFCHDNVGAFLYSILIVLIISMGKANLSKILHKYGCIILS